VALQLGKPKEAVEQWPSGGERSFRIVMAIYKNIIRCRSRDRAPSPFSETLGIRRREEHGSYLYEADAISERG
jgi:hypothetical protein